MFRRAICLLILLSFLLVKHTALFVPGQKAVVAAADYNATDQNTFPETEKESKEPLISYDEFVHDGAFTLFAFVKSALLSPALIIKLSSPYLSLPYTPPDLPA